MNNDNKLINKLVSRAKLYLFLIALLLIKICITDNNLIVPAVIFYIAIVLYTLWVNSKKKSEIESHIEEVANDLGASKFQIFTKIVIPMLMPGILSGAQLALTLSLDDVVISYFTAGPGSNTLPLQVYSMIKTGITPDVNALITIMLGVVFVLLMVSTVVQLRRIKKEAIS